MFMEIFVTAMIVMAMVCAVVHLCRKNVGSGKRADERVICVSWVLLVTCVVTLLDLASGDCGFCRLAFDLTGARCSTWRSNNAICLEANQS